MTNGLLLWVDDEIELLKAHILFLEKKGYQVVTVSNGNDAIDECRQHTFDLILLDEMMPGIEGDHYYLTNEQWKSLSAAYDVAGIPFYLVINKDGSVAQTHLGFPGQEIVKNEIEVALSK